MNWLQPLDKNNTPFIYAVKDESGRALAGLVKSWTEGVPFDEKSQEQVAAVASLPFIFKHVAVMPDVHAGMGATVGSVIPTKGAVIPAAVGVDIGCGMLARKLNVKADELPSLKALRTAIEEAVPHGRSGQGDSSKDIGAWSEIPEAVEETWNYYLRDNYNVITGVFPQIGRRVNSIEHLGTLGTGNHFIELSIDPEDNVWVVLHSGSRGIGNRIGTFFTKLAKEKCAEWFVDLPHPDLAYFPTNSDEGSDYLFAMKWAQLYATLNRQIMLDLVFSALKNFDFPRDITDYRDLDQDQIHCHHNYMTIEHHYGENIYVTRKGAVCARKGMRGIIPGSMGAKTYFVKGKGNPESFHSCSHGAGRVMSRTQAKRTFTVDDHKEATKTVECRKDESVLDETPGAYKDIDLVMEAQKDLVEIENTVSQLVCVKG